MLRYLTNSIAFSNTTLCTQCLRCEITQTRTATQNVRNIVGNTRSACFPVGFNPSSLALLPLQHAWNSNMIFTLDNVLDLSPFWRLLVIQETVHSNTSGLHILATRARIYVNQSVYFGIDTLNTRKLGPLITFTRCTLSCVTQTSSSEQIKSVWCGLLLTN